MPLLPTPVGNNGIWTFTSAVLSNASVERWTVDDTNNGLTGPLAPNTIVVGTTGADTLFDDTTVSDWLVGRGGDDVFVVNNAGDILIQEPGTNSTVYSGVNFTLPVNIDTLKLAGNATVGIGNSDAAGDALYANPNATSTLTGNSAHDVFVVFNAGDQVFGQPGSTDVLLAATDYTLADNVHVDIIKLIGSATEATGNHDAAGDQIWANQGAASTLNGESGNDLFVVFNTGDQ